MTIKNELKECREELKRVKELYDKAIHEIVRLNKRKIGDFSA